VAVSRRARALALLMALAGCGSAPPVETRRALGTVEPGAWSQLSLTFWATERYGATLDYDSVRHTLLLFGGRTLGVTLGDLWSLNSSFPYWSSECIAPCIPVRVSHCATFDPIRGVLVVFGGYDVNHFPLNDTWEWNGTKWNQATPTSKPPARGACSMVFDTVRGRPLMFGGYSTMLLGDSWSWDGTNWTQLTPAHNPPPRDYAGLTWDSGHARALLYGGLGSTFTDTWQWDGSDWNQLFPAHGPPAGAPALAYDPIRARTVLFGLTTTDGDTWEFDGSDWAVTATTGPGTRTQTAMHFFPELRDVVLFGGTFGSQGLEDTWLYRHHGEPCTSGATCDSGNCIDGVCCDQATCNGVCQSCDVPGAIGVCSPVTNADDPDTCGGASTCNASGACELRNGQACSDGSACLSGFCAGGLCCTRACTLACETCNPVGAAGTCVTAPAGTVAAACGAYRCNGANADCPIACALDGDCAPGFYCNAGICSSALPLGMACSADQACQSGHCVDGVCCFSACAGRCQFCGSGMCIVPVGSDPRGECAGDPGCGGACQADGSCAYPGAETPCDVCKVCNQSGRCNQPPRSGDDVRCGAIGCDALSTECRTFADVTHRCVGVGVCAQPNDPTACATSSPAPDDTPCSGGVCRGGACSAPVDAGRGASGASGGCSVGGSPRGAGAPVLLLVGLWVARRRRRGRREIKDGNFSQNRSIIYWMRSERRRDVPCSSERVVP
jgi:hypothetical protein